MNKIVKKIKVLLGMVKDEFEKAVLSDGSEISFDALEINREVYDSEGNPLAEGEYTLEDGTKISVDVNGVIKEIEKADGEIEKEEVVVEAEEAEGGETEGGETAGAKAADGGEAITISVEGIGDVTLTEGYYVTDADGNPVEGEFKSTDGKYSVVIKGGKVAYWKSTEPATTETITVINQDGKKVKVSLKEGTTAKLSDGEYTDVNGEYIVEIKGGSVSGWRSAKAPESPENKPTESDDTLVKRDDLEARIDSLERAVNDIYEMVLKIAENQKEAEVKVDETIQEFSKIKSEPQTAPLHFGSEMKNEEEMTAVDKFLKFKHNK